MQFNKNTYYCGFFKYRLSTFVIQLQKTRHYIVTLRQYSEFDYTQNGQKLLLQEMVSRATNCAYVRPKATVHTVYGIFNRITIQVFYPTSARNQIRNGMLCFLCAILSLTLISNLIP